MSLGGPLFSTDSPSEEYTPYTEMGKAVIKKRVKQVNKLQKVPFLQILIELKIFFDCLHTIRK